MNELLRKRKIDINGSALNETTPNRSCSPDMDDVQQQLYYAKEDDLYDRIAKKAEILLKIKIEKLIPHLYVVLKRLLNLIPISKSTNFSKGILMVTINIVDGVDNAGFNHILRNFVKFHFSLTTSEDDETTFGSMLKCLVVLLEEKKNDLEQLGVIFRQLWFLFDVLIKSMAQWLIRTKKFKTNRRDRFDGDILIKIDNLVTILVELIVKNITTPEVNTANVALAYFLRVSFYF